MRANTVGVSQVLVRGVAVRGIYDERVARPNGLLCPTTECVQTSQRKGARKPQGHYLRLYALRTPEARQNTLTLATHPAVLTLLITCYLLLVTYYLLLITCYLLLK